MSQNVLCDSNVQKNMYRNNQEKNCEEENYFFSGQLLPDYECQWICISLYGNFNLRST
jgi:hypothetical protein